MVTLRMLIFTIVALGLSGCASVPVTGRRQLALVSSSSLEALSAEAYGQMMQEVRLSGDNEKNALLQEVGRRLADSAEKFMRENSMAADIGSYDWEFNLIDDDKTINAFAMAGGKIAVYTGIFSIAKNPQQLATVISHEIAHVIANHSGERMSQLLLANLGNVVLSQAMKEKPETTRQLAAAAYGAGANIGILLPYSRTHEREADRIGLIIMAQAGYDPRAAVDFWLAMNEEAGARPLEFLSTHPDPQRRIESIRGYLPEALGYYK
jgi:predicted Zn-dependent protease